MIPETTEIDVFCGNVRTIAFYNESLQNTFVIVCKSAAVYEDEMRRLEAKPNLNIVQSGFSRFCTKSTLNRPHGGE